MRRKQKIKTKDMLWSVLFLGMFSLMALWIGRSATKCIGIARNGIEAVATVTDRSEHKHRSGHAGEQKHTEFYYTIVYNGHIAKDVTLHRYRNIGETAPVLYLPMNPSVVMSGSRNDSAWSLLNHELGKPAVLMMLAGGLMLFASIVTLFYED